MHLLQETFNTREHTPLASVGDSRSPSATLSKSVLVLGEVKSGVALAGRISTLILPRPSEPSKPKPQHFYMQIYVLSSMIVTHMSPEVSLFSDSSLIFV